MGEGEGPFRICLSEVIWRCISWIWFGVFRELIGPYVGTLGRSFIKNSQAIDLPVVYIQTCRESVNIGRVHVITIEISDTSSYRNDICLVTFNSLFKSDRDLIATPIYFGVKCGDRSDEQVSLYGPRVDTFIKNKHGKDV